MRRLASGRDEQRRGPRGGGRGGGDGAIVGGCAEAAVPWAGFGIVGGAGESGSGRHHDEACDVGALQSPEWIATIRSKMSRGKRSERARYVNRLRKQSQSNFF